MYLPKHFSADAVGAKRLIDEYPFATVCTLDENGQPFFSHLPLLLEAREAAPWRVIGHMSRRNPQWRQLIRGATVIFHGPHTYVTPTWYVSGRDVPTWNYAVVEVRGSVQLIESAAGLTEILRGLTKKFEVSPAPWEFDLPDDLQDPRALEAAIVGFSLEVEILAAKVKLGQNRAAADIEGVLKGLATRDDENSRKIRALMLEPQ